MAEASINWYRSPIEKETLRNLTKRSDLRGWIQAGSFLVIYAALTGLAIFFFSMRWWAPMVIVCYLHSLFVNMMGISAAVHELSHGTPFKTKWVNEVFLYLFSFLTWNNPIHFRASHILSHHQFTLFEAGRDNEVHPVPVKEKLNWANLLSWFTFDWKWFAVFMRVNILHALGQGDADFFFWKPLFQRDDPKRKAMCAWARVVVIGYLVILAAAIYFHLWVVIYLVFSYYFARIIAQITGAIQHTGLAFDTPDWRAVCHTVNLNPILRYLYWNMNYHTEHHMYAAVPFFNLPKLRQVIEKDVPAAHKNLFACLKKLYEIRARQEEDPNYFYIHQFPATAALPRLR